MVIRRGLSLPIFILPLNFLLQPLLWGAVVGPSGSAKIPAANITSGAVAQWSRAIGTYFSSKSPDPLALKGLLPSLGRFDFSDPATIAALQPLAESVQSQARELLSLAKSLPSQRLPESVSKASAQKLETLNTVLQPLLHPEQRDRVQQAAQFQRKKLPAAQRKKLNRRMREIAEQLKMPLDGEPDIAGGAVVDADRSPGSKEELPKEGRLKPSLRRMATAGIRKSAAHLLGLDQGDASDLDVRVFSNDKELHEFAQEAALTHDADELEAFWTLLSRAPRDKGETLLRQAMLRAAMAELKNLEARKEEAYSWLAALKGLLSIPENHRKTAMELLFEANGYDTKKLQESIESMRRKIAKNRLSQLSQEEESLLPLERYINSVESVPAFISAGRSLKDPLMDGMLDELEARLKAQALPSLATLVDWVKGQESQRLDALGRQRSELKSLVTSLGAILSFARLAQKDEYGQAAFDQDKPAGYSQGWLFTLPKKGYDAWPKEESTPAQVPTDSGRDTPFKIFTGSNMSGKSFHLKQDYFIQRLGQAFGWVPAKAANLRFFDRLVFIDRAETDSFQNLSAFGTEAQRWLKGLEKLTRLDGKQTMVYLWADEGFSTTSPGDQSLLLTAALRVARKAGMRYSLATHNEEFIERHRHDSDVSFYHFKVNLDEGGAPRYTRQLQEGVDESHAIAVARALGLNEEVLDKAQAYMGGKMTAAKPSAMRRTMDIAPYDEATRERLKEKRGHFLEFFPFSNHVVSGDAQYGLRWKHAPRVHDYNGPSVQELRKTMVPAPSGYTPLFPHLSREREFAPDLGYSGMTISGGDADLLDEVVLPRLRHMVVATPVLTPQQVLERQRLFDLLAKESPQELTGLVKKMRNLSLTLRTFSEENLESLNEFNLLLLRSLVKEVDGYLVKKYRVAEMFLAFLDFNSLLTGIPMQDLGVGEEIDKLKALVDKSRGRRGETAAEGKGIRASVNRIWVALEHRLPPVSALDGSKRQIILTEFARMKPHVHKYFNENPSLGFGDGMDWATLFQTLPHLLSSEDLGGDLFARLRAMDSVYTYQFANYLEPLWRTYLGDIRSGMDYVRQVRTGRRGTRLSRDDETVVFTELSKLTDLFRFAQLIQETPRSRVRFHDKPEIHVAEAWNPYAETPEAKQVRNEARLSPETPVELLSGSNMSGKTFYQRAVVWALLEAISTGYAPGSVWMPVLTRIFFLDRVAGKLHRTLSAFGQEVELWKALLDAADKDDGFKVAAIDEAWSTTSPRYQSALSFAVAQWGMEHGVFSLIASHSHDFLRDFAETHGSSARTSHFRTRLDDNGMPSYDYIKQTGHQPSNAVMAARRMGLTVLTDAIADLTQSLPNTALRPATGD